MGQPLGELLKGGLKASGKKLRGQRRYMKPGALLALGSRKEGMERKRKAQSG